MVIASVVLKPTFASTREARALSFASIRAVMNADLLMGSVRNVVGILCGVHRLRDSVHRLCDTYAKSTIDARYNSYYDYQ
jgi:hypothetical protein